MGIKKTVLVEVREKLEIVKAFRKIGLIIQDRWLQDPFGHDFSLLKPVADCHNQHSLFIVSRESDTAYKQKAVLRVKLAQQFTAGLFLKSLLQLILPLPKIEIAPGASAQKPAQDDDDQANHERRRSFCFLLQHTTPYRSGLMSLLFHAMRLVHEHPEPSCPEFEGLFG